VDTVASAEGSGGISGVGIAAVFAGGILVWSGVKGYSVSTTFKDLIAGKQPKQTDPSNPVTIGGLFSPLGGLLSPTKLLSATPTSVGNPVDQSSQKNKALGQQLAQSFGWSSGAQWDAINNIIMGESGWNQHAANPTSDARGIGQKISGWSANYQENNAAQQILWTYSYIKQRYGDPVTAWAFHQANGWY
jgi:hypothetical protein